ncbi:transcriptional regulator, partial [Halorubrum sp. C3]
MSRPDVTPPTPAESSAGLDPIAAMSILDDTTRAN